MPDYLEWLTDLTQADIDPVLSTEELNRILVRYATWDSNGTDPIDTGWIPTYNIMSAAAAGWRMKAGKASPNFNVGIGTGKTFNLEQIYTHCMEQANRYASLANESIQMDIGEPWPFGSAYPWPGWPAYLAEIS
jgi:hypothetical protein